MTTADTTPIKSRIASAQGEAIAAMEALGFSVEVVPQTPKKPSIPPEATKLARWLTRYVAQYAPEANMAHDPTTQRLLWQFDDMVLVPCPVCPDRQEAREQAIKAAGNAVARWVQGQCAAQRKEPQP